MRIPKGVHLNETSSGVTLNKTTLNKTCILNKSNTSLNSPSRKSTSVKDFSHGVEGHQHYVGTQRIPDISTDISRSSVHYSRREKKRMNIGCISAIIIILIFFSPIIFGVLKISFSIFLGILGL